MNKKVLILAIALLPIFVACSESKTPSVEPTSDPGDGGGEIIPPTSDSSTDEGSSDSEVTPPQPTDAEIIAKALKDLHGSYTEVDTSDPTDTYTYSFSLAESNRFAIEASVSNSDNEYSYQVRVEFEWSNLKDQKLVGQITYGSEVLRGNITCTYGDAPTISYASFEETESTFKPTRPKESFVKSLVNYEQTAFNKTQAYVKTINSSYSLW